MKKYLFIFIAVFFLAHAGMAQKIGYIDSNYILSKMPAYGKVQQEMDKYAENWQKEIERLQQESEKLKQEYRAEEVLLTEEMKKKRQAELNKKEREVRDYQQKVFGYEGMMFKRRQDLMRPIQDEVFIAVEKVSKARQIAIMFDKSGDLVMIYTNPVHDYTEYVLEELGLASENANAKGKQPTDALKENPDDLPEVGEGEQEQEKQKPAQPVRPTKKKSNN